VKQEMSKKVIYLVSQKIGKSCFVDIDFSACHAHIAASLKSCQDSALMTAVTKSQHFWNTEATKYTKLLNALNVPIDTSPVRAILKVSFYTALNGGNPLNVTRLGANLKLNAPSLLQPYACLDEFSKSSTLEKLKQVLQNMSLLEDVKELNKACFNKEKGVTYTDDRKKGYQIDSQHKGISRVLQGVEVVLLSLLVPAIVKRGGIPLNLVHDGALVIFPNNCKPSDLCFELSKDISKWSKYLLKGLDIGVEPKFSVINGILHK
jgi:hypothetical protein